MPHQQNSLLSFLGTVAYGDFADMTTYRSQRGKIVWFAKTWPDKPPSYLQTLDRAKFSAAAQAWQLLTAAEKEQWKLAAQRASLCMTGYNLFVYCQLGHDPTRIATIARQTGTTITCPCHGGYS